MKKLLIIAMIAILTLGFSVAAFADEDAKSDTAAVAKGDTKITIGGDIRFRGTFTHNTAGTVNAGTAIYSTTVNQGYPTGFPGVTNGTTKTKVATMDYSDAHRAWYDTRVRLSIDAKVSDTIEGFVELETGTSNVSDTDVWGDTGQTSNSGAAGLYRSGNAKAGTMYLRQAWIQYAKNGFGVKVGHQPLILGNGIFFDHTKFGDDAIVAFVQPTKGLTIAAITAKLKEGTTGVTATDANTINDADAYVLLASYKSPNFNVSGDVSYVNDQAWQGTAGDRAHLLNVGLRADGTFGPVLVRGDVEVQNGTLNSGNLDIHARGWAMVTGVDYKVVKPVKLTLEFAYGSGDGTDFDAKSSTDQSTVLKSFISSQGTDQHYTLVYDYFVRSACSAIYQGDLAGSFGQSNGLCNTMYLKAGVAADISKAFYGELNIYWLRAAKPVAINVYDSSNTTDTQYDAIAATLGARHASTDLGWEIDAKLEYKLSKNLKYWVEGGYLFTGAAYDHIENITTTNTLNTTTGRTDTNYSFDLVRNDAYALRNGIQLSF